MTISRRRGSSRRQRTAEALTKELCERSSRVSLCSPASSRNPASEIMSRSVSEIAQSFSEVRLRSWPIAARSTSSTTRSEFSIQSSLSRPRVASPRAAAAENREPELA